MLVKLQHCSLSPPPPYLPHPASLVTQWLQNTNITPPFWVDSGTERPSPSLSWPAATKEGRGGRKGERGSRRKWASRGREGQGRVAFPPAKALTPRLASPRHCVVLPSCHRDAAAAAAAATTPPPIERPSTSFPPIPCVRVAATPEAGHKTPSRATPRHATPLHHPGCSWTT